MAYRTLDVKFSHALKGTKSEVFAMNSDWLIALFAPVVISQIKYFGIILLTVICHMHYKKN